MPRLKIDMSTIFDDERKLIYIYIRPEWESVESLQNHVCHIFDIQTICFLQDDCYIPPLESIEVIKLNDILRAFIPSEQFTHKKKKRKRIKSTTEKEVYELPENEHELVSSTPNGNHQEKKTRSMNGFNESEDIYHSPNGFNSNLEENKINGCEDVLSKSIEDNSTKQKRKRKRQKEIIHSNESNQKSTELITKTRKNKTANESAKNKISETKGHLFFDENGNAMNKATILTPPTSRHVVFKCKLNEMPQNQQRSFKIERKPKEESTQKQPLIEVLDVVVLKPFKDKFLQPDVNIHMKEEMKANDSSVVEVFSFDDSEIIEVNNTKDSLDEQSKSSCNEKNLLNISEIIPLTEPLVGLPAIGDIIVFKMHFLDKNIPRISGFIAGKCVDVNVKEESVNCLILDGLEEFNNITNDNNRTDQVPGTNSDTPNLPLLYLKLSNIVETKIFKMS